MCHQTCLLPIARDHQDDGAVTELVSVDADVGAMHVGLAERVCGWKPTPMAQWVDEMVSTLGNLTCTSCRLCIIHFHIFH